MNKNGHIILGLILGIIFIGVMHYNFGWYNLHDYKFYAIAIFIVLLFPILPDIDHESGTVTWMLFGIGLFGCIIGLLWFMYLLYFSLALLVLIFITVKLTKHRGIIHTVWAGIIFSLPLWYIFDYRIFLLAFVEYYSHLLGDGYLLKLK